MTHRTVSERATVDMTVRGTRLNVAALHRSGSADPVVFLHGFGSTKEDYADIVRYRDFDDRPFLAYDAPGCGATRCDDLSRLSIPFLVDTARAMLDALSIDRFHLVGHSMGGLTALMLAQAEPARVLSFVDIEGNLAPEDCFLSRQIVDFPSDDPEAFFEAFIARTADSPAYSSALYATGLRYKVRAAAVPGIFRSMVHLSDHGALLDAFLGLPFPRMFMYGEQNAGLSYLPLIESRGVQLCEIEHCGHFPMYSNPPAMWRAIARFQRGTRAQSLAADASSR